MKVYRVSTGSYSDERTHSIWSTKEKAEKINELLDDANSIEEWELDMVPQDDDFWWLFKFSPDGTCTERKAKSYGYGDIEDNEGYLEVEVETKSFDVEKAFKIATDKRAEYLAKKHGI